MIYTGPYPSLNARFAAVPQLVRHVVERSPDHPAIVDASSRAVVTYAVPAGQIDRVAAERAGRGFAPGNVLALRAPNMPAWAGVAARQTEATVEAEWTAHLGEEATAGLRHALARLREIADPYQ